MAKRANVTIDPDNPGLTGEFFARARRGLDHLPAPMREAIETTRRHGRGPQRAPTKELVSLRLSREVLDAYRGTGRGWQTRIDQALQRAAARMRKAQPSGRRSTTRARTARKSRAS